MSKHINGQPKIKPSSLKPLIKANYTLIPLQGQTKKPQDLNWTSKVYNNDQQVAHMKRNNNVGVRLTSSDLVIDVDPRNSPVQSANELLSSFASAYKVDLSDLPTVETGGGGFHLYLKKPEQTSIVGQLPNFPGIEFKTKGQQVVAPGSIHPETKRLYAWDPLCDDPSLAPMASAELLNAISKNISDQAVPLRAGQYEPHQIEEMLEALDPADFREHDDWFRLMCAVHHASAGAAKCEFINWSTSDPEFAHHAQEISSRWDSLKTGGKELVTHRTLHQILVAAGRPDLIARFEFQEVNDHASDTGQTPILESNAPMTIAKAMLKGTTYRRYNTSWFKYDPPHGHYVEVLDEEFNAHCWNWVDGARISHSPQTGGESKTLRATKNLINNVQDAAKAQRQKTGKVPSWIDPRPNDPPANELLVCANGLLHIPTRTLIPPTERLFCLNSSPVSFDPNAPAPRLWLRFLSEVFPNEKDCIDTLQEVTGYFLTQDTWLQKIIQFVGPPRGGKGVYTRILQALVGEGNYVAPTPKRLAKDFGLQPLIGKQLAIMTDMRLSRQTDHGSLVETLLTVSGEDPITISRKHKESVTTTLNTRFLLVSNETLQLKDTSNALNARMILIKCRQSFAGREDPHLAEKLLNELPGILNWALDGLSRLKERGHLIQPESCRDELDQMKMLESPVRWFLDNEVLIGPGYETSKDDLFSDFVQWASEEGHNYTGAKNHFFKDLRSAGADYVPSKPRINGRRVPMAIGIEAIEHYRRRKLIEARQDFKDVAL